ncbi:hypothetical protein SHIRM173S_09585 [Streptomyces hirsutus]
MPISPNQGSSGGGTPVTITGSNLTGTTAVRFGTRLATSVTNVTPTQVTAVSPSGTGAVGVTVTTPGGTSNPIPFYYVGAPFKQSLSPAFGSTAGGDTITINGTGFSSATSVSFGANTAVPTVVSDSQLTVVAPAGAAGSVGVSVTTAGGTNNGLRVHLRPTPCPSARTDKRNTRQPSAPPALTPSPPHTTATTTASLRTTRPPS